ncbi:MAG TPA: DUF3445 domain-containing protein [Acidimicrobiales bacterium]|nr:DUF3445 domain-containing protein [Acidimicrobiales bacterium]
MRPRPATTDALPPPWLDELQLTPGPPWHPMGTRALDESQWLIADEARTDELRAKARLVRERPDAVVASCGGPAVRAAEAEAAALVGAAVGGALGSAPTPLIAAALSVQEDRCVLVRNDDDGGWVLASGVVCFPSMWRLSDKVGLPLAAVHGPVPAYAEELAFRVDRFVDRLRADRPVWRRNWLIHDSPELHLPEPPPPPTTPRTVPDDLWLRSERQTLRRLPRTGAVLFTIRTQQVPLSVVAARPDIAAGMMSAVRAWSDDLLAYRSAVRWQPSVVTWLEGAALLGHGLNGQGTPADH